MTPLLAGLDGVYLFVEPLGPDVEEKGITGEVLESEVELRLREAGIPVLYPDADGPQVPGFPTLYLHVTAIPGQYTEECIYTIRLELAQEARLARDEKMPVFPAPTWALDGVGIGGRKWRQALVEDVIGFTDQFIQSYLTANPHLAGRTR